MERKRRENKNFEKLKELTPKLQLPIILWQGTNIQ